MRVAQATAIGGAVLVIGQSLSDSPPPRTPEVTAAEADTRAFLDERAATHLRRLRER